MRETVNGKLRTIFRGEKGVYSLGGVMYNAICEWARGKSSKDISYTVAGVKF